MESLTGESLGESYRDFSHDFGIPEHLKFDGYSAQVGRNTLFVKRVRKYDTHYHIFSPCKLNENPAEGFSLGLLGLDICYCVSYFLTVFVNNVF